MTNTTQASTRMNESPASTTTEPVCTAKIVWLFNCVGTPDSLLYWNEILPRYLQRFPNSDFFTARPPAKQIPGTDKIVQCAGSWRIPLGRRQNSYDRQLVIPSIGILDRLSQLCPDVIVVQELLVYAIYVALFRSRFPKTKLLLLLESDPIRGIPSRRRNWVRVVRRLVAKRMDWCLTNNQSGKDYLERELFFPPERIIASPYLVSVPPPTDSTAERHSLPLPLHSDKDKTVFLYVGQLISRKGLRQLIAALEQVDVSLRRQARFWLVGDGSQRGELQAMVAQRGLSECVRFVGSQPYEKLAEFYQAANCFVMPTLDDYRALVGFEALRYGLPLLHSQFDGAAQELVVEGENGFVINPYDTHGFARAIEQLIRQASQLPQMGAYSAERSQRYFTLSAAVDNLGAAIRRCLAT